jgi:hypothetical protein
LLNTCWPTYAGSRPNKKKEIFKSHKEYSFHMAENNTSVSNLGENLIAADVTLKHLFIKNT